MIRREFDNPGAVRRHKGTRVCNKRLNAYTLCFLKYILEIAGIRCANEMELQPQSLWRRPRSP
jgi:hypothetical protein